MWRCWDEFWFSSRDARSLSLLRVLSGCMLCYTHIVWGLKWSAFLGPEGFQDPLLVHAYQAGTTAWSAWWLAPAGWGWPVHWGCLAVLLSYTLGLWTRLTSIAAAIITISTAQRAPLANFGLDQMNTLLVVYLAIGPCGAYWSLDAYRRTRAGRGPVGDTVSATISTRLIQLHLCLLYLFSGLGKLKGDTWWDGTAFWWAVGNQEYQTTDLTFLAHYPLLVNFITHLTIVWESLFWLLVWIPAWKPWALLIGVAVHLGIGACLGMWTFGLIMIFSYVSFIQPATLHRLWHAALHCVGRGPSPLGAAHSPGEQAPCDPVLAKPTTGPQSLCILLLCLWHSGCQPAAPTAQQLLEQGRYWLAENNPQSAVDALSQALTHDPRLVDAWYERALARERLGDLDAALADYSQAISLQEHHLPSLNNRAAVFARLERYDEAVAGFSEVVSLGPSDPVAWMNRGLAPHDSGQYEPAIADFTRAAELNPADPEPWFLMGNTSLDADRPEQAIEQFSQAIHLFPLHARAWKNRGEAQRRLGKVDLAAADIARAEQIDPSLREEEVAVPLPEGTSEPSSAPNAPSPLP